MSAPATLLSAVLWIGLSGLLPGASLTGFSPAFGQPGNVITVRGTGFTAASLVEFNANSATDADFIVLSDTLLQTVVPVGATTGPLRVTFGGSSLTTSSNFVVAPAIASFAPPFGAVGTPVVIYGANFVAGGTTVTFPGAAAVTGTVTSSSQVDATVPAGTTNGPIIVTTTAGSAVSAASYTISNAPLVTSFSPTLATNGTTVVINGANFAVGNTTVKFGTVTASSVTVVSTTQLHAVVPSGAGTGPITVTVSGKGTFVTSTNFVTAFGLLVTSFTPAYGKPNDVVFIDGSGLNAVTAVTFSNNVAATITGQSDTEIQVHVPSGAITGKIKVFSATNAFATVSNFTVLSGPLITDFSPSVGQVGAMVVINGENFTGASAVKLGGKSASGTVTADTQISITVPAGATSGPVAVTVGTSTYTTSSNFTVVTAAPYIASFTPTNAVRGEAITITGGNFANLSSPAVRLGGAAASNAPLVASTQLTAYVPSNAVTGGITVSSTSGTGTNTSLLYLQPWITNFTPVKGWVYSNIVVTGRNFTNATAVSVSGVNYAFTGSATQIVATVPATATNGFLTITTPGGVIISTNTFSILPKIFGFSPVLGPINDLVTITGTSLQNVIDVQFNGADSVPINASFGQVSAIVPSNGFTGPITVITPVGSDTSVSNFIVTQPSEVHFFKTADASLVTPGTHVTYTLALTNLGPSIITTVVVTDSLPAGLTFLSGGSSVGSVTFTNPVVYWNIPILTNGTAASATVVATASESARLANIAGVNFAEGALSGGFHVATSAVYFVSDPLRTLDVDRTGNELVVHWPVSALNFGLELNTNLSLPTNWSAVHPPPVTIGGSNYSTNALTLPAEFFRLKTP
ncbi:MAG TPA: IPT/TIG domain-containing protein [Verrucomicrobiae bacterium]|nr:IPT/TIG domain-containing protein [Verrucomicrobiae bacterium]